MNHTYNKIIGKNMVLLKGAYNMQYVKFGKTGMDVSRICLGMMSFGRPGKENGVFPWAKDYEEGKELFKRAIDLGINYFDTANVYQMGTSEEITGRYIHDF